MDMERGCKVPVDGTISILICSAFTIHNEAAKNRILNNKHDFMLNDKQTEYVLNNSTEDSNTTAAHT